MRVCARLPLCFTRVAYISRDGFVCLSGSNVTVAIPLRNRTLLSPVTFDCLQFLLVGRVPLWVHPKSRWKWLRIDRVLAALQAGAPVLNLGMRNDEWEGERETGGSREPDVLCAALPTVPHYLQWAHFSSLILSPWIFELVAPAVKRHKEPDKSIFQGFIYTFIYIFIYYNLWLIFLATLSPERIKLVHIDKHSTAQ